MTSIHENLSMRTTSSHPQHELLSTIQETHTGCEEPCESFELVDLVALNRPHDEEFSMLLRRESSPSIPSTGRSHFIHRKLPALRRTMKHMTNSITRIPKRIRRNGIHGWRMGIFFGICSSIFVLCCNIIALVVAKRNGTSRGDGTLILASGRAISMSRWNTALHLMINGFSTVLLAASNYTTQVLCSPTRSDIDRMHARGSWLDVGLLSLRNLRYLPRGRVALGLMLGISSLPLHLFYNAAIAEVLVSSQKYPLKVIELAQTRPPSTSGFRKFTNSTWSDMYSTFFVSDHVDLFLAIESPGFDASLNFTETSVQSRPIPLWPSNPLIKSNWSPASKITNQTFPWNRHAVFVEYENLNQKYDRVWSTGDSYRDSTRDHHFWPDYTHVVESCVHLLDEEKSYIQLSQQLTLIVISVNFLKLLIMLWVLVTDRSGYLVTLGDAAASFLDCPDPWTQGQCVLGKDDHLTKLGYRAHLGSRNQDLPALQERLDGKWTTGMVRYSAALSEDRQHFFFIMLICVCGANLVCPLAKVGETAWGTASSTTLVLNVSSDILKSCIINSPQAGLSICYVCLNNICTFLAGAEEWNSYASIRKGLRVSRPLGKQRGTYFLQLPYRWAIPLIVISGALHWLLSQSLFLTRVDVSEGTSYGWGRCTAESSVSVLGFSGLSLIIFLNISFLLMCVISWRLSRYVHQRIPIVAACSLVISAACHPPSHAIDTHLARVKWGCAVKGDEGSAGHCCLSAEMVTEPEAGKVYL